MKLFSKKRQPHDVQPGTSDRFGMYRYLAVMFYSISVGALMIIAFILKMTPRARGQLEGNAGLGVIVLAFPSILIAIVVAKYLRNVITLREFIKRNVILIVCATMLIFLSAILSVYYGRSLENKDASYLQHQKEIQQFVASATSSSQCMQLLNSEYYSWQSCMGRTVKDNENYQECLRQADVVQKNKFHPNDEGWKETTRNVCRGLYARVTGDASICSGNDYCLGAYKYGR